ncbi:hypothetical protein [Burkholderia contaminans]|uniref:hypothetical protein n=1 Tax=Burkholderia contaminans TaxID=488447 RepID=UPI00158D98C9|nr:hypothetical protein [Burkholderia contaminans]
MFGFGKKKSQEGTEEQLHETMNFGGFGGLKKRSSPGTTEQATKSGRVDNSLLDEVEKYDEKIFVGGQTILAQFRKDTEAGRTHAPKDFFKSVVNNKNEYEPEVQVISAYLFYHWYEEAIENKCKNLKNLLEVTKKLKTFLEGRENTAVLKDFSGYMMVALAINMIGFLSKENPAKKEELQKAMLSVAALCEAFLKREDTSAQTEQTISSSSSSNGKPFEDAVERTGKTIEQVMKAMEEDVAPVFYKKDPNTFSQVANYFYAIFLKLKDNLKQGNQVELDLDVNIPLNMLKSSSVFSKDTATSYITSAFNVATSIFINIDTRDLKAGERLSLVQLTTAMIDTVGENCNKLLGIETKQQVQEKKIEPSNGEDKKDWKKLTESVQNNPNIPDDLKKGLKDITSFFSGETPLAEIQFKNAIESLTDDQTKVKYLETLDGNIFTATFSSDYFKEYYPNTNALKAELKNVDKYIEFYAYGIYANVHSEDREFALTKFSVKLGEADNNEIAAMVFGVACSAIVQNRAGKESIHAQIFTIASQYLEHQEKSKAETKASFAEGFKERGIEVSDSTLNTVSQFAEDYARNKAKEANAEQPKQEVKEAPKPGFFDDKPKKTEYKLNPNFAENAENLADIFKQVAEGLIKEVREASHSGNSVEDVFKHYCYQHVIRYHLQSAAFAQFSLMESTLHYCQKINRPELHLVEMVTLAHWRPLLEIAYEELHAPILNGEVKSVEDQNKIVQNFQRIARNVVSGMKDNSEYRNMTDEEIIVDFLEVIPFYQVMFLDMPFAIAIGGLSPLVNETKDYLLRQSDEYNQTWVTTALMFAYDTALDMKKMGMGIGLDQYPNQGPNFALLMLFFFHQINQDMKIEDSNGVPLATGMEPRYPLSIIPEVERVKENMMIAMAGSHVFEELVPNLESSKATEKKVESVEQADEVPSENEGGKFSALFRYIENNKDDIAFRGAVKELKKGPVKEKLIEFLDAGALKDAIEGLGLEEYFPNPEKTEAELKSDEKYIDFYVVGAVATATENKELAFKKFSEKMENASNTEIAALLMGVSSMASALVGQGKTSHHTDLFELAQEHLGKTSTKTYKARILGWFDDCGIEEPDFAMLSLVANKVYISEQKDDYQGMRMAEKAFSDEDYWSIADTPFGQAMIYSGLAIHSAINNGLGDEAGHFFNGFKAILNWLDELEENKEEKDVKYMFLNIPFSMIRQAKNTPQAIMSAMSEMAEHARKKINGELPSSTNEIMGKMATLTKALLDSGMGDEEDRAKLRKNLEELKGAGFTPGEIPEATEESSGFSPEKTKEIKSKMLPWFKNSGIKVNDDILALSFVINKIIEAEKDGYTDLKDGVKNLSDVSVFKELYPTDFGQAVLYATFAIANTLDNEEILTDMIDGYIDILNWLVDQKERAKMGFYILLTSGIVFMYMDAAKYDGDLKEAFTELKDDFLLKVKAWANDEGVSAELLKH